MENKETKAVVKIEKNYFEVLNSINVNDKTEKKNNLTYLAWAWAWGEVKKIHPDAFYTIYETANGTIYHTDGRTAWVKTGVTIPASKNEHFNGEHIEYLPVMDFRNQSISVEKITSFEVNKAIQRSLTKALARHGLGLYIYAGEDLPESENKPDTKPDIVLPKAVDANVTKKSFADNFKCVVCGKEVSQDIAEGSIRGYKKVYCSGTCKVKGAIL